MFIRLREMTSARCQSMAHIAIYVNLYTIMRAVPPSTCNVVLLGPLLEHLIISKPLDRIHIWSDDRYGSKGFLSTIPTPTHGMKIKVTDLKVYS